MLQKKSRLGLSLDGFLCSGLLKTAKVFVSPFLGGRGTQELVRRVFYFFMDYLLKVRLPFPRRSCMWTRPSSFFSGPRTGRAVMALLSMRSKSSATD